MECTDDKCTSTDVMRKVNADYAQCQVCGHHWKPSKYIKTFEDLTEEDAIKIAEAATGYKYRGKDVTTNPEFTITVTLLEGGVKVVFYLKNGKIFCAQKNGENLHSPCFVDFIKASQKAKELGYYLY